MWLKVHHFAHAKQHQGVNWASHSNRQYVHCPQALQLVEAHAEMDENGVLYAQRRTMVANISEGLV